LKPKNRKSQSRMKLKDSAREPRARTSQIQFDLPKKIYSDSNRGYSNSGTGINKTKSILKAPKTIPEEIYRDQNRVSLLKYSLIETDLRFPRKFSKEKFASKLRFASKIFEKFYAKQRFALFYSYNLASSASFNSSKSISYAHFEIEWN
jgi:hypothetical protein